VTEAAQFLIEEVADLTGRGGLLVTGRVLSGRIARGDILRDATTSVAATVLGVEFETPRTRALNLTTLVVERTDPTPVSVGRILVT
jgi:hypothetical protein